MRQRKKPKQSSATAEKTVLILLNKPFGVVSQFSGDDHNLSAYIKTPGVYPAGRLDKDSEGLLLLTNNGKLQHRIAEPKLKMEKSYWAQVEGVASEDALAALCSGVTLRDGLAKAISATQIPPPAILWQRHPPIRERKNVPTSWINLVISEGRNRQVRRMTAAVDLPTLRLIRHRIGKWSIDNIPSGKYLTIEDNYTNLISK
jgi:23S rRNA pseudouridine2457 synthase